MSAAGFVDLIEFVSTESFYIGGVPSSLRSSIMSLDQGITTSSFSGCLYDFSYSANSSFPYLESLTGADATNSK